MVPLTLADRLLLPTVSWLAPRKKSPPPSIEPAVLATPPDMSNWPPASMMNRAWPPDPLTSWTRLPFSTVMVAFAAVLLSAKESRKPPARVTMLALPALADSEKVTEPALLIVALPADPLSPMNRKPLLSMVAVPAVELPRMLVKPVLVIVAPVRSPLATSSDPAKATVTAPVIDPALPPTVPSCSVPAATVVPPP